MRYFTNKKTVVQLYKLDGSWDAVNIDAQHEFSADKYVLIKSPDQHIELYFGVLETWLTVDNNNYGFVEYDTGYHILVAYEDIDSFILQ